jgi:glutathionylspermidine synthase
MRRVTSTPRKDWTTTVESQGLIYHHTAGGVYWDESAFYQFSAAEVDTLEAATNELQRLCLEAGQHIIDHDLFRRLAIPDRAVDAIRWAWQNEPPAIYGRFDLAYDGSGAPKLLEYNADTPTALLESAVVQWYWLQDLHPRADQFNSIHERLVAKWKELRGYVTEPLYFASAEDAQAEDMMTVTYLRDTAQEAGLQTSALLVKDIGWREATGEFVDLGGASIRSIFKLYPWEWLIHEEFGAHALATYRNVQWIEPIWKMLWSNKGLLAVLWEMFPNHPNLLPTYFDAPTGLREYVRKPLLSREGANITYVSDNHKLETEGDYGEDGHVYQALGPVPCIGGNYPVVGSWVIDGEAGGMGIRESRGPITDNLSRFVPHLFET